MDDSSNNKGSEVDVILENQKGVMVEVSLAFSFSISKNQAEYEACIAGLQLAQDFKANRVKLHTDSLLVVSKIKEEVNAKNVVLQVGKG